MEQEGGRLPFADNRPETVAQRKLQDAVNNSEIVQRQKNLQAAVNNSPRVVAQRMAAPGNHGVIQRQNVFKDDTKTYTNDSDELSASEIDGDSSATSISYSADPNLPTPRKVLKDIFGPKLKNGVFWQKIPTREKFDRPRKIVATIDAESFDNRHDEVTREIGTLGNDEITLREGKAPTSNFYDGGHLIGDKILGQHSRHPYNIAPQEVKANEHWYNHTIENVLRKSSEHGTRYTYEIKLDYTKNNYRVDQKHLVDKGILKSYDHTKPWTIYIPSRIPSRWTAKATWKKGGKFRPATNAKVDESVSGDIVNSFPYEHADPSRRARFHLEQSETTLSFQMGQYVPSDPPANAKIDANKADHDGNLENPMDYETPKDKAALLPKIKTLCDSLPDQLEEQRKRITEHESQAYRTKVFDIPAWQINDELYDVCDADSASEIARLHTHAKASITGAANRKKVLRKIENLKDQLDKAFDQKVDELKLDMETAIDGIKKDIEAAQSELSSMLSEVQNAEATVTSSKAAATTPDTVTDQQAMMMFDELDSIKIRLPLWENTDVDECFSKLTTAETDLANWADEDHDTTVARHIRSELNYTYMEIVPDARPNYMALMEGTRDQSIIEHTDFSTMHAAWLEAEAAKETEAAPIETDETETTVTAPATEPKTDDAEMESTDAKPKLSRKVSGVKRKLVESYDTDRDLTTEARELSRKPSRTSIDMTSSEAAEKLAAETESALAKSDKKDGKDPSEDEDMT